MRLKYIKSLDAKAAALPQALHLATLIASIIVNDRSDLMPELLDAAAQYRGITVEQIDQLLDHLQEQVQLMANMFSVRVEQQTSFRDIMSRAHEQMSDAAIDALPQIGGERAWRFGGCRAGSVAQCHRSIRTEIPRHVARYLARSGVRHAACKGLDPARCGGCKPECGYEPGPIY